MSNLDLYTQMRGLCEQAKQEAGLFTAYQQDLTIHDRSYIADDAQAGDVLLWVIKTCGTWLALIEGTREYARAILNTVAAGERIYLIEVDRHTGKLAFGRIRPQTLSQAKEAVETLRTKEDRTPRRVYLADQLKALGLDQTIVATDLSRISREPGQSAYLKFEGSLLQVLVPSAGIDRVLHRPQVTEATAYRLEVTSAFGHAELHEITPAAFKRHLMRMSGNPPKHRAA